MSNQQRLLDLLIVSQRGLSARAIGAKAGLSHATISKYLDGEFPAVIKDDTLAKIAKGFSIPLPRVRAAYLADRGLRDAASEEPTTGTDAVVDAIMADPNLLPEAKSHLVNQYGLLLRVQAAAASPASVQAAATRDQLADLRAGRRPSAAKKETASQKAAAKAAERKAAAKRPD